MAEQPHNQTDSQGRKQGYWEETGKWGKIEKGHYVDGLRQGAWQIYREDGVTLGSEGNYLNGERQGLWKSYYDDGILREEGPYHNGQQHGLWKVYHEDGVTLYVEGHYLKGDKHGVWKYHHSDGVTLRQETPYLNGQLHGLWKEYYPDGVTLRQETPYLKGEVHGIWKTYYEDGVTLKEETEHFDKGDPLIFEYNKDGTIRRAYYSAEENEEHTYISQGEIEVYNKVIFSVGRETWKAIPRELFDYLTHIEIL